jgi:hypothetical protein
LLRRMKDFDERIAGVAAASDRALQQLVAIVGHPSNKDKKSSRAGLLKNVAD